MSGRPRLSSPFYFFAGLVTVPRELYEAARIDGASRLQTFRSRHLAGAEAHARGDAHLPNARRVPMFDAIYALTEGGPANTTETLSVYAYKMLMRAGDFGYGSALSVATFVSVMILAAVYLKWLGSSAGIG